MIFIIAFVVFLILAFMTSKNCESGVDERYNKHGERQDTAAFHFVCGGPYHTKKEWEYIHGYEPIEKVIEKYRTKIK